MEAKRATALTASNVTFANTGVALCPGSRASLLIVADDSDWRLLGQEKWLAGRTLIWKRWSPYKPGWDHDHCEFCTVHLADRTLSDDADTQLEGYVTEDDQHWVCRNCFRDFRDRFKWTPVGGPVG